MLSNHVLEELKVGKSYSGEELRHFIAYDQVGSVIFCRETLICKDDPDARFTVENILEGYISKRRNDYKDYFDAKQKIYIVTKKHV